MSSSQETSFKTVLPFLVDLHVWLGKGKGQIPALGLSFWVASPLCPRLRRDKWGGH